MDRLHAESGQALDSLDVVDTVKIGLHAARERVREGVETQLGHIEDVARQNNPRAAVAVGSDARFGSTAALAKVATLATSAPEVGGGFSPLESAAARSDLDVAVERKAYLEGSSHLQAA